MLLSHNEVYHSKAFHYFKATSVSLWALLLLEILTITNKRLNKITTKFLKVKKWLAKK
jgi:hypothetical protein